MTTTSLDSTARQRARARRVGSAVLVAAVSTLIAALAHATAGGGWPNAVTLLVALVLSTFLSTPIIGARVRGWRIATAVALDQLVFHTLFATIGSATALPGTPHAHHEPLLTFALGAESQAIGLGMGAHHVIAAVASFALLRGGWALLGTALSAGAEFLVRGFRTLVALPALPRAPHVTPTFAVPSRLEVLRYRLQRRGPPIFISLG